MSRLANPREHDDLLNYRLKRLASAGGAPAVRLCEGRYGIARQEWRVLAALVESGAMGSSALAERCQIERAVVSRQIGVLVGKRLVRRRARSSERSSAEVEATPAGAELYAALFPQLAEINRRLMAVLDEAESLQLECLIDKLWERARELRHVDIVDQPVHADRRRGGSRRRWADATKSER
jgi:DNA-binding MarR family transcriptional regulator